MIKQIVLFHMILVSIKLNALSLCNANFCILDEYASIRTYNMRIIPRKCIYTYSGFTQGYTFLHSLF